MDPTDGARLEAAETIFEVRSEAQADPKRWRYPGSKTLDDPQRGSQIG